MLKPLTLLSLLLFNFGIAPLTYAEDAAAKGLSIVTEADKRDTGWKDSTAAMHMVLINAAGQRSEREIRIKNLEIEGDGDKSQSIFDSPKDVQGTSFLSFSHALEADEQWLYLPALKRVKRISSANKSGPFMGSEFAFEDLSSNEIAKYTYEYLRDETVDGMDCYVVRAYPQYEASGYKYRDAWIDKVEYRLIKADFYDRKGSLLKTLSQTGYKQYVGKFWRADQFTMVNHQTNKRTELTWKDYQFQVGLTDADFNRNSLMRSK